MARGGHSSSRCAGLSLSRPLLLRSTGSRHAGSVVVAHGPSCSAACGILPDQGSNLCPLHWQADSQPLRHPGSPQGSFLFPSEFLGGSRRLTVFDHLLPPKSPRDYQLHTNSPDWCPQNLSTTHGGQQMHQKWKVILWITFSL